jgi:hypothetical protein
VTLDGAATSPVSTTSDSSGLGAFDLGVNDSYTVQVSDSSFPAAGAWGTTTAEYQTTSTPAFNIDLATSSNPYPLQVKVVTGRVTIAYGATGASKAVNLYYRKSNGTWSTAVAKALATPSTGNTDSSGNCTWAGLPPGDYYCMIQITTSNKKYSPKFTVGSGVSAPYVYNSTSMSLTTAPAP